MWCVLFGWVVGVVGESEEGEEEVDLIEDVKGRVTGCSIACTWDSHMVE